MQPAIRIEQLSKQYRLGQVGTGTMSHDLNRWWAAIRGREDPYSKVGQVNRRSEEATGQYVWALKDIDFEVPPGETLAIIGANGAGKSTLLKLISRITCPTVGRILARGRIASLLEVGTGMHPEMTARENVYLNGSILGMRHSEIKQRFDDIIDFAGCKMFVDTPVKRFSSGMRVRLGFAVAAFLEPEILIVDEVLAVGDAEFQRRAIAKMQEISRSAGRTILFVSHNMAAIENLCRRAILLREGQVACDLPAADAVKEYLSRDVEVAATKEFASVQDRRGSGDARFTKVQLYDSTSKPTDSFRCGEGCQVKLTFEVKIPRVDLDFGIVISSESGQRIARVQTRIACHERPTLGSGHHSVTCVIPRLMLVPGVYQLTFGMSTQSGEMLDLLDREMAFSMLETDYFGTGKVPNAKGGHTLLDCDWSFDSAMMRAEG